MGKQKKPDELIPFTKPKETRPLRVELNESWVDRVYASFPEKNREHADKRDVVNKYREKGLFRKSPGLVMGVEHEINTRESQPRPIKSSQSGEAYECTKTENP
jgi:hypothetical protein